MFFNLTGSEKLNMAASKTRLTYILACRQDSDEITMALSVFEVQLSNGTIKNVVRHNQKWKIQDGDLKTGSTHISACIHDRNEILTVSN